ncbi:hypothetical protein RchiOBHm_Chr2g0171641 [Rosa chinensis]|uniref:Uncharacterized protein n=1 Tax=Rosa chinensis TaxID=74649 RepID=A0A2P6S5F9_ROSCH|nr:hypothetical protein RchiOBHm_Chr2g0171641 [Rosa chinensis]
MDVDMICAFERNLLEVKLLPSGYEDSDNSHRKNMHFYTCSCYLKDVRSFRRGKGNTK